MIRLATINDLKQIMNVIDSAKKQLKLSGSKQWNLDDGYPDATTIIDDIVNEQIYVCEDMVNNIITGCVVMLKNIDPNYEIDNFWSNNESYVSIHRLAVLNEYLNKGIASSLIKYCIDNCDTVNVRIDTHKINKPMIGLLTKLNFTYKGVITLKQFNEDNLRNAYEYITNNKAQNN